MEQLLGIVVFGLLLAIAIIGLVTSTRRAEANNASRHAFGPGPTVHPADQQSPVGAVMAHPSRRVDPNNRDIIA